MHCPDVVIYNSSNLISSWKYTLEIVEAVRDILLFSLSNKRSSPFVLEKGDIVLIKEPLAFRADWKFGQIVKVDQRLALAQVHSNGRTFQ